MNKILQFLSIWRVFLLLIFQQSIFLSSPAYATLLSSRDSLIIVANQDINKLNPKEKDTSKEEDVIADPTVNEVLEPDRVKQGATLTNILDNGQKIFTILGIAVGGVWVYFNFFKGRVYRVRIEPTISGEVFDNDDVTYVIVKIQLKNVGLSKVDIQQKGSGFRVYAYQGSGNISKTQRVKVERLGTFSIFEDHGWIESSEKITEEQLISLPKNNYFAFLLELRVVVQSISFKTKTVVSVPRQNVFDK
jgi:hypothetical protein